MHRKIVITVLIIHLFIMMLVVSFNAKFDLTNRGMIIVGILALYTALLFLYLKTKALYVFVVLGVVFYLLLNASAFAFLILDSLPSLKERDIASLSLVFLPGVYCSLAYFVFLIKDRKHRTTVT